MDSVKFYYITKNARQLSFDNRSYVVPIVESEVHIVYQDANLCRENRLKGKLARMSGGRNAVTAVKFPAGAKMCKECERLYKANGQLDWYKWTKSIGESREAR